MEKRCDPMHTCEWASNRYAQIANGPFKIEDVIAVDRIIYHQKIVDSTGGFICRGKIKRIQPVFAQVQLMWAEHLMVKP
jgi:hypothetical protein